MNKHSLYGVIVDEVKFIGNTKNGNQRYKITVSTDSEMTSRRTKGNCFVNYAAKNLRPGDVVDLITDGRGSVIEILPSSLTV